MDAPVDDFAEVDDYLKPSKAQERLPLYLLFAATGTVVATLIGIILWLEFATSDITEELRSLRPQTTMRIPPMRRSARTETAQQSDGEEEPRPSRSDKQVPRGPKGTDAQAAVLHPHPDPKLIQPTDTGPLPIIGKDGRQPWRVYSRPFNALEKRPRIAIIVTGLGVSFNATESALDQLPGEVTFSFAPFADKLKDWIDTVRGAGHEVLLELPMEPKDFPRSDPGPFGLLTSLQPDQNLRRFEWILSRMTGYVGVINPRGDRFSGNKSAMQPIMTELKRRGLMFVDSMENTISTGPSIATALKLPFARNSRIIDTVASRAEIGRQLVEVENVAKSQGVAVAMARPYPVTIRVLKRWIGRLADKGLVLAPVTAVANRQKKL